MGAENSILEGCEWDDPVESPPSFLWQLSPVTKTDGTHATIFEPKSTENKDGQLLKKGASILRTLRHPNIIRFIGFSESSSHVWLATESVVPLVSFVQELSSEELCVGLYDILQGLDFLHSKLGMSHNNLCLSSIYVSADGTWKLGGFEHACKFSDATQEFLEKCRAFRKEDTLSPEEKSGKVSIDAAINHSRDIFAFGCLVEAAIDLVKEKDDQLKLLEHQMSCCSSLEPSSRPKVSELLKMSVFSLDLIDILCFLKHITIKSDAEKKEFFSTLLPRLQSLSETVLARRLVMPLLARFVLLNEWAEKLVLPDLLVPKNGSSGGRSSSVRGLLPESLYKEFVINHLFNIFHVHDSHIRLILLEHFSHFAHLFSREQLEDDIFIQILIGIRDTNDKIVAASLRALADLVPLLGGDYVIGGRRKPFFFHGLPKKLSPQDLLKMDIPKNIDSALSHKPLLKDLAMTKKLSSVEKSSLDKDKKARERELRREEAKLKREERRKKLKEQVQDDNNKEHSMDSNSVTSCLTIEQAAGLDLETIDVVNPTSNGDIDHSESLPVTESGESFENGDGKESPDWSDWENDEQRISEEIEAELENMSQNVAAKVQTSPSPYQNRIAPSPPPLKVDWSDSFPNDSWNSQKKVNKEKTFNGPLTLKTKPKQTEAATVYTNKETLDEWGSDNWEAAEANSITKFSSPGKKPLSGEKNSSAKTSSAKSQSKRNDDLGMGLDIKSIEIVPKSPPAELDFFADMAPTILMTQSKGDSLITEETNTKLPNEFEMSSSSKTSKPVSAEKESLSNKDASLFAVKITATEEDVGGWGEANADWDTEHL
ncbi:protein-associating with the carboxyl-terminal domain of ezrin-like [Biomphalaria glabrata]|uniref:Protein-associating with the carboxyl-terminal domain of ezrin-like n=1 Tax=Biomphalaria glabrata TaxID=6526 RepID=A0A9U8EIU9_BIOGL|nr:protein-associating with the carboxyl-terminal domain of ezrin-like [Biomphalaria glabrata]XP_055896457.1 protein-associating with the carboxyl-terminal domain of ezrin-like [Biomphalaria glabrata]